jgi:hypothetical protein
MVDVLVGVAGVNVVALEAAAQESAMELWAHEGAHDEDMDSIEAIKERSRPKTILSRMPYARHHTRVAKSGDTSGKKAHGGVASTEHV